MAGVRARHGDPDGHARDGPAAREGLAQCRGGAGPVVVQFVQHLAHPPVELASWPDDSRQSRVVFITRNISEKQVRQLFAAVRGLL